MSWDNIKIDFGKINGWKFISILLTIIIVVFLWTGKQRENELMSAVETISQYKSDTIKFKTIINDQNQEIATQQSIITVRTKQTQKVLMENSTLKELNHQVKMASATVIKDVKAAYTGNKSISNGEVLDSMNFVPDTVYVDRKSYIALGTSFAKQNEWFSINGTIEFGGINISSLQIRNEQEVNIGCGKRNGLFRPRPLEVEVINKNPYTNVVDMKNIYLKHPKKKWYQTKAFAFGLGVVGGITAISIIN